MSIAERAQYGAALKLMERHGMVVVTQDRWDAIKRVVEAAEAVRAEVSVYEMLTTRDWQYQTLKDALAALNE